MSLSYKLNTDIVARTAANLSWSLNQLHSSIYINNKNCSINGKSLVGILTANMKYGDIITIIYDEPTDLTNIKEIFNELGGEI